MDSEVNDVIQIGSILFRIGRGMTLAAIKAITAAYYAKWSGQTSFRRLHNICGSHMGYLEIGTQDQAVLKQVLSATLDKYSVLYSPLPDLNPEDGRLQIAFNADQAASVTAALNYYNSMKLEKLKTAKEKYGEGTEKYFREKEAIEASMPAIRSVTAEDYALSRLGSDGRETEEYKRLEESAINEIQKEETKKKEGAQEETKEIKTEEKAEKIREIKTKKEIEEKIKAGTARRLPLATEPAVEYVNAGGTKSPLYLARFADGENSLLLSPSQMADGKTAVIEPGRNYRVISNQTGKVSHMRGEEVLEKFSSLPVAVSALTREPSRVPQKACTAVRSLS